jgi:hypothetical protein
MSSSTLTSERADKKRFLRRLGAFAAGFVLLYALAYLATSSEYFEGTYIRTQRFKLEQMAGGPDYEMIILGDSTAMAIDPSEPAAGGVGPGCSVYNFALANLGGVYPIHSAAKKYLDSGRRPRVILLAFLPTLLTGSSDILAGSNFTRFYAAHFYSLSDLLGDEVLRSHPRALASLLSEKYRLRVPTHGYDIPLDPAMTARPRERGGQFLILENTRASEADVRRRCRSQGDFRASAQSLRFLGMLLTLAERHGVAVVLFVMPAPETALQSPAAERDRAVYFETLRGLAADHSNLTVLEQNWALPDECFATDATHLNRDGAERFHREFWPLLLQKAHAAAETHDSPPGRPAAGSPPGPRALGPSPRSSRRRRRDSDPEPNRGGPTC